MFQALREKFLSDKKLLNALIDTGNAKLVENSPYDYYWGVGRNGTGKNRLGELIMMLREVLAND
jgi:ribA/ribD-fused uncharacterized protein